MTLMARLARELAVLKADSALDCGAAPVMDDMLCWKAYINGPHDTPYHGGVFWLTITFPDEYPFKPVKMVFDTPVFHPNVDRRGNICLDLLKDSWSPALTIHKLLLSVSSLLTDANCSDPLEPDIAKLYMSSKQLFDQQAKAWTVAYAIPK